MPLEVASPFAQRQVYHLRQAQVPAFRFEYHPGVRKLYVIPTQQIGDLSPSVARLLMDNVPDHGAATNFVLAWCRGWRTRDAQDGSVELQKLPA
jgi:hypothetical protein